MASKPLIVAGIAGVLLFASVGFEVAFRRNYTLEVRQTDGWQAIGVSGNEQARAYPTPAGVTQPVPVTPNSTLEFRLRVDNGYPWAFDQHYYILAQGLTVAEGQLTAPARGVGDSSFTVPAKTLLAGYRPNVPIKDGFSSNVTYVSLEARLGKAGVYANFQVEVNG